MDTQPYLARSVTSSASQSRQQKGSGQQGSGTFFLVSRPGRERALGCRRRRRRTAGRGQSRLQARTMLGLKSQVAPPHHDEQTTLRRRLGQAHLATPVPLGQSAMRWGCPSQDLATRRRRGGVPVRGGTDGTTIRVVPPSSRRGRGGGQNRWLTLNRAGALATRTYGRKTAKTFTS